MRIKVRNVTAGAVIRIYLYIGSTVVVTSVHLTYPSMNHHHLGKLFCQTPDENHAGKGKLCANCPLRNTRMNRVPDS